MPQHYYFGRECAKLDKSGLYWGYIGIMEKKMETTITGLLGFRLILGLYYVGLQQGALLRWCQLLVG